MIKITNVKNNSTADKLGIKTNDIIISINNKDITDYIDYNYQVADHRFKMKIKKPNEEIVEYDIIRSYDEELGIEFDNIIFDGLNKCKNKCIFCFVDQQPKNMRDTLNLKDDDYRFSFLQGSYITLTNLSEKDFERIIRYRLSPLNISVHTTDPDLRYYMMKNPKAKDIKKQLDFLSENGINFNTQIVLCPKINDKENLNKSIEDLIEYYPNILSLAVVPVGLTKYKNKNLRVYTKAEAVKVLNQIKNWQEKIKEKYDTNFLYASDEFYLLADKDIPDYKHYNDFPQLENGVGLTRILRDSYYNKYVNEVNNLSNNKNRVQYHILTSILGKEAIKPIIGDINSKQNKVKLTIDIVDNNFFGKTVTVAGLLTAQDLQKKIDNSNYKNIIIPKVMLNDKNKFLDDIDINDFKNIYDDRNIYLCNDIRDLMEVLTNE